VKRWDVGSWNKSKVRSELAAHLTTRVVIYPAKSRQKGMMVFRLGRTWRPKRQNPAIYSVRQSGTEQLLSFDEHEIGIFEMLNNNSEEPPGFDAVNYSVIECQREGHNLSNRDLSASHDRPILDLS